MHCCARAPSGDASLFEQPINLEPQNLGFDSADRGDAHENVADDGCGQSARTVHAQPDAADQSDAGPVNPYETADGPHHGVLDAQLRCDAADEGAMQRYLCDVLLPAEEAYASKLLALERSHARLQRVLTPLELEGTMPWPLRAVIYESHALLLSDIRALMRTVEPGLNERVLSRFLRAAKYLEACVTYQHWYKYAAAFAASRPHVLAAVSAIEDEDEGLGVAHTMLQLLQAPIIHLFVFHAHTEHIGRMLPRVDWGFPLQQRWNEMVGMLGVAARWMREQPLSSVPMDAEQLAVFEFCLRLPFVERNRFLDPERRFILRDECEMVDPCSTKKGAERPVEVNVFSDLLLVGVEDQKGEFRVSHQVDLSSSACAVDELDLAPLVIVISSNTSQLFLRSQSAIEKDRLYVKLRSILRGRQPPFAPNVAILDDYDALHPRRPAWYLSLRSPPKLSNGLFLIDGAIF